MVNGLPYLRRMLSSGGMCFENVNIFHESDVAAHNSLRTSPGRSNDEACNPAACLTLTRCSGSPIRTRSPSHRTGVAGMTKNMAPEVACRRMVTRVASGRVSDDCEFSTAK